MNRTKREKELCEVLEVARAAIGDAIYCEDGLDGSAGLAVMKWITDLLGDEDTYTFIIEGISDQSQKLLDKALNRQELPKE